MADQRVETKLGDTGPEQLAGINLERANQKNEHPTEERHRTQHAHGFQEGIRRNNHVRKKKCGEPAGECQLVQRQQERIQRRIKDERKRADHDDEFQSDDEGKNNHAVGR